MMAVSLMNLIKWSAGSYSVSEFLKLYEPRLPIIATIKSFGSPDITAHRLSDTELIGVGQILRIDSVTDVQRRVVVDLVDQDLAVNIPLDCPVKFDIPQRKKKKLKLNKIILSSAYELPLLVEVDSKYMGYFEKAGGAKATGDAKKRSIKMILKKHTGESFLKTNFINEGIMHPRVIFLSASLQLELVVAEGYDEAKTGKATWEIFQNMYQLTSAAKTSAPKNGKKKISDNRLINGPGLYMMATMAKRIAINGSGSEPNNLEERDSSTAIATNTTTAAITDGPATADTTIEAETSIPVASVATATTIATNEATTSESVKGTLSSSPPPTPPTAACEQPQPPIAATSAATERKTTAESSTNVTTTTTTAVATATRIVSASNAAGDGEDGGERAGKASNQLAERRFQNSAKNSGSNNMTETKAAATEIDQVESGMLNPGIPTKAGYAENGAGSYNSLIGTEKMPRAEEQRKTDRKSSKDDDDDPSTVKKSGTRETFDEDSSSSGDTINLDESLQASNIDGVDHATSLSTQVLQVRPRPTPRQTVRTNEARHFVTEMVLGSTGIFRVELLSDDQVGLTGHPSSLTNGGEFHGRQTMILNGSTSNDESDEDLDEPEFIKTSERSVSEESTSTLESSEEEATTSMALPRKVPRNTAHDFFSHRVHSHGNDGTVYAMENKELSPISSRMMLKNSPNLDKTRAVQTLSLDESKKYAEEYGEHGGDVTEQVSQIATGTESNGVKLRPAVSLDRRRRKLVADVPHHPTTRHRRDEEEQLSREDSRITRFMLNEDYLTTSAITSPLGQEKSAQRSPENGVMISNLSQHPSFQSHPGPLPQQSSTLPRNWSTLQPPSSSPRYVVSVELPPFSNRDAGTAINTGSQPHFSAESLKRDIPTGKEGAGNHGRLRRIKTMVEDVEAEDNWNSQIKTDITTWWNSTPDLEVQKPLALSRQRASAAAEEHGSRRWSEENTRSTLDVRGLRANRGDVKDLDDAFRGVNGIVDGTALAIRSPLTQEITVFTVRNQADIDGRDVPNKPIERRSTTLGCSREGKSTKNPWSFEEVIHSNHVEGNGRFLNQVLNNPYSNPAAKEQKEHNRRFSLKVRTSEQERNVNSNLMRVGKEERPSNLKVRTTEITKHSNSNVGRPEEIRRSNLNVRTDAIVRKPSEGRHSKLNVRTSEQVLRPRMNVASEEIRRSNFNVRTTSEQLHGSHFDVRTPEQMNRSNSDLRTSPERRAKVRASEKNRHAHVNQQQKLGRREIHDRNRTGVRKSQTEREEDQRDSLTRFESHRSEVTGLQIRTSRRGNDGYLDEESKQRLKEWKSGRREDEHYMDRIPESRGIRRENSYGVVNGRSALVRTSSHQPQSMQNDANRKLSPYRILDSATRNSRLPALVDDSSTVWKDLRQTRQGNTKTENQKQAETRRSTVEGSTYPVDVTVLETIRDLDRYLKEQDPDAQSIASSQFNDQHELTVRQGTQGMMSCF